MIDPLVRVIERFRQYVPIGDPNECWEWSKSVGNHGYGQIGWQTQGTRTVVLTHRLAWEIECGPIPDGLTIDHQCRNRRCCNPGHLSLLSNVDNACDNGQATKTQCPKDHPYDESNTHWDTKGHRRCKACARERNRNG